MVLFIGQLASGGAEKVLTMIANHYCWKGYEVEIVMLLGNTVNRDHFGLYDSINVVDLSNKGSYFSNAFSWLKNIRAYLKTVKPNVVISFIGRINALVLTASIGIKIPIIVSERNDPKNDGRSHVMQRYCDWIYRKAAAIVYQTSYQKGCFSNRHSYKSYIVPNPIKILPVPTTNVDAKLVVTAGRLQPSKNHLMLVRAMGIVNRTCPHVRCEIYGDGDLKDSLSDVINKLHLEGVVKLAGKKSNITDYVASSSVFVMTSEFEGLSNSLIEAMMLGKVCVSTDYPGVEDLIEDGKTGLIVKRNDAEGLAKAIINVITDTTGKYDVLRANARTKVMTFDDKSVLSKWDEIIDKATGL